MKKILLGCMLLMAGAGCPTPFDDEEKARPEPIGDPRLADDPNCRFCGVRGIACCPNTCREASGVPLNRYFCLYNLRCLPVPGSDGGETKTCVD
jgi:hypothetical protein